MSSKTGKRDLKAVAQQVMSTSSSKKSMRSIAQAFLKEKRNLATPVPSLDHNYNENESVGPEDKNAFKGQSSSKLTRVQSARGKTNSVSSLKNEGENNSDEGNNSSNVFEEQLENKFYIRKKCISRFKEPSEDSDDDNNNQMKFSTFNDSSFTIPHEFKWDTKEKLVQQIIELRKILRQEESRVKDLEEYIDNKLKNILEQGFNALEI